MSKDLSRLENNLFTSLFFEVVSENNIEDGNDYVGSLGKLDRYIRPDHLKNNGYFWENGKTPPSRASKTPWNEANCRCSWYFGKKQELINASYKEYLG